MLCGYVLNITTYISVFDACGVLIRKFDARKTKYKIKAIIKHCAVRTKQSYDDADHFYSVLDANSQCFA